MSAFMSDRTVSTCSLMGDGTAFVATGVSSTAAAVFKFSGFKGQTFLGQLEVQFSAMSNSSVNVTIGLYRKYNSSTTVLTEPVAGMSLSAATQSASFTYNVGTMSNVHASGGGVTYALDCYLTNHHVGSAIPTSDLYVVVLTDHIGLSTVSGLNLVHTF